MTALAQQIRIASRSLRRSPTLTAAVVLTLALCIGATAAVFGVVRAVLFRPLPFADPDGVMVVRELWRGRPGSMSAGNWGDLARESRAFRYLVPIQPTGVNLAAGDVPENVAAARVGADFFPLLGVPAALGRGFRADEDQPGRGNVVVLSDGLWRRRFGADPDVVGREIRLDGRPYAVVGVMPRSLDYTLFGEELWVPIALTQERLAMHDEHYLTVLGRLAPGATADQARAELARVAASLRARYPNENRDRDLAFAPLIEELVRDYRPRLYVLLGAVGFVLLIACANIANLLLTRATGRAHEIAVRAAIGARRGDIVRQSLVESLLIAGAGGLAGVGVAYWGVRLLVAIGPADVPRLAQARVDGPVLLCAVVITLASGLVFGLGPALRMAGRLPQEALKEGGRTGGGGRDRLRGALVVVEIALALVLLTGAGLLVRSAVALGDVNPGFDPRNVLAARVSLPAAAYATPTQVAQGFTRIAEELEGASGAESAALVSAAPLEDGSSNGLIPEGRPLDPSSSIDAAMRIVTPGYFRTMRVALRRGRTFTAQDGPTAPRVMLINETLARQAFPGHDPIGRRIACCEEAADGKGVVWKEVVGVVADVRARALGQEPDAEFYLPMAQAPAAAWDWVDRTMTLAVRTPADPVAAVGALRRAVRAVDPALAVYNVGTMDSRIAASLAQSRFSTLLLTGFGAMALLLAAIGVYGVISYGVAQRTREIGIRMALGAERAHVLRMVVRHGATLAVVGMAFGLAAALALTRLLAGLLFRVSPTDPPTFAIGTLVLTTVAIVAALLPARRASRVDPMVALRYE